MEEETNEKIEKLNETIDSLRTQINSIPSEDKIKEKVKKSRKRESSSSDENLNIQTFDIPNILVKYPISIYRDINGNKVKDMVASECAFIVKYQYEISNKTNNKNELSISEIVDYIIIQEKLTKQEKNKLLNKYERCEYLHKTYKDRLNIFKFDIGHVAYMTKEEWKEWLQELHKLIKQEYPNEIADNIVIDKCDYVYTKGKNKGEKCGKIECRTKSHKKIRLYNEITDYKYDSGYESCYSVCEDDIVDNIFINDDIFNIDINYIFDEYYENKYDNIDIDINDFKYNMGLCLENDCKNKIEPNEDMCIQCFNKDKYETSDEEIYQMNLNKYYKEVIDKYYIFDFENIIKNINRKTYTYEDYISDIVNIENNIEK